MKIITTISQLQEYRDTIKDKTIGFVPTMGALHLGHISLITQARENNDIVIVSIFVNPTQFLKNEDLESYPSTNEADIKVCQISGVDIIFMPSIDTMYKKDEILVKAPKYFGFILEGYNRPEHFDGVLQIILKLFNLIKPTNGYFGKKDAQQLALIKQMVNNLFLKVNIIECDIVRDDDGLALSSRNIYLNNSQRQKALKISKSLKIATSMILNNNYDCNNIINEMRIILNDIDIEYIQIVSRDFRSLKTYQPKNSIILVAVRIGNTRLIDNIWI